MEYSLKHGRLRGHFRWVFAIEFSRLRRYCDRSIDLPVPQQRLAQKPEVFCGGNELYFSTTRGAVSEITIISLEVFRYRRCTKAPCGCG
jgi:hypothetical protein